MLTGLFRGAVAELVAEALESLASRPSDAGEGESAAGGRLRRVAVVGDVALGRALLAVQRRRPPAADAPPALTIVVEPGARAARKLDGALEGSATAIPLADAALDGIVGVGALSASDGQPLLHEWLRVVRPGGAVVLVDRVARTEATRRALCAGLTELEQRSTARVAITSGRLAAFAPR
jgi:SAM-dependent methyltransferase